eukprot:1187339-Prorocentrum_minimum.AAC.5
MHTSICRSGSAARACEKLAAAVSNSRRKAASLRTGSQWCEGQGYKPAPCDNGVRDRGIYTCPMSQWCEGLVPARGKGSLSRPKSAETFEISGPLGRFGSRVIACLTTRSVGVSTCSSIPSGTVAGGALVAADP